jgi:hypothetical protein
MRRYHLGALGASLSALALALLLAGCGGSKDEDQADEGAKVVKKKPKPGNKPGAGQGSSTGSNVQLLEGKGTTTIKGLIRVKGDPKPAVEEMTKSLHDQIAKKDTDYCMSGKPTETTEQNYRIGDNNQVGNVFVWIAPPSKEYAFKVDQKLVDEAKAHALEIEQPHCAFLPHASVYFPQYPDPKNPKNMLPTGQKFIVLNDAKISHNTRVSGGYLNPGGEGTLAPDAKKDVQLVPDVEPVTVKCNIHPWMDGYVRVFDHPFATVSKSDTAPKNLRVDKGDKSFGTYEIKNAPAGVKVRLIAWHEKAGFLTPPEGKEIETKEGEMTIDPFEMDVVVK